MKQSKGRCISKDRKRLSLFRHGRRDTEKRQEGWERAELSEARDLWFSIGIPLPSSEPGAQEGTQHMRVNGKENRWRMWSWADSL